MTSVFVSFGPQENAGVEMAVPAVVDVLLVVMNASGPLKLDQRGKKMGW